MRELKQGQIYQCEAGELVIEKLIGRGKSGYSYLSLFKGAEVVLKLMHNEPVPYYTFNGNKLDREIEACNELAELKVPIPKLFFCCKEDNCLIKEFIEGETADLLIAGNNIAETHIAQLFDIYRKVKSAGYNADYFPSNFVVSNNCLYYIDYELNPYSWQWNLENRGLYYWANSNGFSEFLKSAEASCINADVERGIPVKEPFERIVKNWIEKYSMDK